MSGWTHEKRLEVELAFFDFLRSCYINSRDYGTIICLGENLYYGQHLFIQKVFDGLESGRHKFYVLKSRQLGMSTLVRALSVFYIGIHDGLQGALVLDTGEHKESARSEVVDMLSNLPTSLRFPGIKHDNRQGITLKNQSKILFKSAGIRASKGSGTLGRSVGLSMAHLSELCSYDNDEGLEAFEQSLSDLNPDRLYIYESTARGFNIWHDLWAEARKDPDHCTCIFLGWWSKQSQVIKKTDVDFLKYGTQAPTDKELRRISEVKRLYEYQITPEQLAWIRRKMDPSAKAEGDAPIEYDGGTLRLQEQPWVEEDAFQFTGSVFFPPEKLTEQAQEYVSNAYKTYMYGAGVEFADMRVYKASNNKSIELKVWEEPDPEGVYVIAADPAFGANEKNDRSAIQVLRCYADCVEQVAEYAWPLINTRQFGWVIASLLGWYAGEKSPVYLIVELNGPGEAVWNELQSLKQYVSNSYDTKKIEEKGLQNVFRNVRNYIYSRSDSMAPGFNYHFKTTGNLKISIMERLRDFMSNSMLHIRSMETLEEMRSVTREGDTIASQGRKKDDRVMALAMGIRCWEEKARRSLVTNKRTKSNEQAKQRMTVRDQADMYQRHQLDAFFAVKRVARYREMKFARRAEWRAR